MVLAQSVQAATVDPAPPGDQRRPLEGKGGLHAARPGSGVLMF